VIFVGIDNGMDGAIVAIRPNGDPVLVEPTPTFTPGGTTKKRVDAEGNLKGGNPSTKRVPDIQGQVRFLREIVVAAGGNPADVFAILEKAQAYPKEGAVTSFNYGRGYGAWEAALSALDIPFEIMDPKQWGAVLKGIEGEDTKERARMKAQRALPKVSLILPRCRVPHKGLPDAACMALFGIAYHRARRASG
jgi:hypothetical protein